VPGGRQVASRSAQLVQTRRRLAAAAAACTLRPHPTLPLYSGLFLGGITALDHLDELRITHVVVSLWQLGRGARNVAPLAPALPSRLPLLSRFSPFPPSFLSPPSANCSQW
jgi:hypothetical protein